ncbi:hypothetical protein CUMW_284460 [Citrus unshiu]|uniref:O-methyltransferase domain-containing protein n=2 Tax=Citrus TaxID=2706 RepID=A0A2H5N2Q7_CITUN|nr:hypothetical protein CUMW_284460 [Citrus unshiu]
MGSLQDDHQVMLKPARDEQDFLLAMELASGAVLPMTIKSATELGLLEIMAKASPTQLSSSEIASQLPTNNKKAPIILDRMLRLLASYSFLTCNLVSNKDGSVQRLYGLTPVSKYFVPNKDGVSLAPTLLIIQDQVNMDSWSCAKDALLEGSVPFMKAHNGMDGFAAAAKDERINNLFNQSMHNHTTIVMKEILEIYKGFEGLNQLVDVAGGLGANLKSIVSKYPQLRGINFDLPHVLKHAPSCPGVEHVGGDMFVEVPKGQAIFMKWILHDWSDEDCSKILRNCYEAIPESGKVILVESIVPEFPETDIVSKNIASLDLHLSNLFPGAKERTLAEFKALATEAGFTDIKVICRVYCYWVIEFYKTI